MTENGPRFRRIVLENREIRRLLMQPIERSACVERMLALSRDCGCPLTRAEIDAAEMPPGERERKGLPPETERYTDPATIASRLEGWVPGAVTWVDNTPCIDWFDPGDTGFTEPFFAKTVARGRFLPFSCWFALRTPISVLERLAAVDPGLPPTGFLFHISRCGSTLVTQMLAALNRNIVLSEPGPVDAVLLARFLHPEVTAERQEQWLRWMLSALGRPRSPASDRLFVKFDAWHTPLLPVIRAVFPCVPWVFLFRDPQEVLVSHRREAGMHMAAGALPAPLFGINADAAAAMPCEAYRMQVITSLCRAALDSHAADPGLFVDYRDLPDAVVTRMAEAFGIEWTPEEAAAMRAVTGAHAKRPHEPFTDDTASKRKEAEDCLPPAARERLDALYARMRAVREGNACSTPGRQENPS